MKNIHVLPTDKPSRLHNKNGQLGHIATILYIEDFIGNKHNSFNIYITSDEEIISFNEINSLPLSDGKDIQTNMSNI